MDTINGINFEDWAAACANLAQGMEMDRICEILGVETPVFEDTNNQFIAKMASFSPEEMKFYGEVFSNPKVGKFADLSDAAGGKEEVLKIVPDYDTYHDIFVHCSVAEDYGITTQSVLEQYGLNLGQWTQITQHYSDWIHKHLEHSNPEYGDRFKAHTKQEKKLEKKYKAKYKESSANLGGDIEF